MERSDSDDEEKNIINENKQEEDEGMGGPPAPPSLEGFEKFKKESKQEKWAKVEVEAAKKEVSKELQEMLEKAKSEVSDLKKNASEDLSSKLRLYKNLEKLYNKNKAPLDTLNLQLKTVMLAHKQKTFDVKVLGGMLETYQLEMEQTKDYCLKNQDQKNSKLYAVMELRFSKYDPLIKKTLDNFELLNKEVEKLDNESFMLALKASDRMAVSKYIESEVNSVKKEIDAIKNVNKVQSNDGEEKKQDDKGGVKKGALNQDPYEQTLIKDKLFHTVRRKAVSKKENLSVQAVLKLAEEQAKEKFAYTEEEIYKLLFALVGEEKMSNPEVSMEENMNELQSIFQGIAFNASNQLSDTPRSKIKEILGYDIVETYNKRFREVSEKSKVNGFKTEEDSDGGEKSDKSEDVFFDPNMNPSDDSSYQRQVRELEKFKQQLDEINEIRQKEFLEKEKIIEEKSKTVEEEKKKVEEVKKHVEEEKKKVEEEKKQVEEDKKKGPPSGPKRRINY